jgi:hypothetical protein
VTGDVCEGFELGMSQGPKHDLLAMPLDEHLRPWKSESLGQPHRLAASVLEYFGCFHIYEMYLQDG